MQVGLLWFDNDPHRGLASKIEDAARHYQEKFGTSSGYMLCESSYFQ